MCDRMKVSIGFSASLAFAALIASTGVMLTPFWWKQHINGTSVGNGLFLRCEEPYEEDRRCTWGLEDITDDQDLTDITTKQLWVSDKEVYIDVVRFLWVGGTGVLLLGTLFLFTLCYKPCRTHRTICAMAASVFFAAAVLAAAVVMFGLQMEDQYSDDTVDEEYDWGYYVAVGASVSALLAGCVLMCALCAEGRKTCELK